MYFMSTELLKPKEQRLKRLEEDQHSSERAISNFSFCYKIPNRCIDSDEDAEERGRSAAAQCYSVNFEDDDDLKSNSRSIKSRKCVSKNLYEQLTEKVQTHMGLVEGLIQQYHQQEVPIETVQKMLDSIRVVTRDPVFEFDDFTILKNFDQAITRDGIISGPISCRRLPSLLFNNIGSLVKLDLELETHNYTLKPIYQTTDSDMLSFVGVGTGKLADIILTAGVADNSIVFLCPQRETVLFCVPLASRSASKFVVSAINIGNELWVLFEDWSLEKYDVIRQLT